MAKVRAWLTSAASHPLLCLGLILASYSLLLLPTVARQGISWDEQTDLDIARSYLVRPAGWLRGSDSDPSQTRLPMAVVAVVYALLGTEDLITARLVSYLVGALTLVGVFVACRRDFGTETGVLAGGILATSPYFLSFARTAFTETDIYVACAFAWLLVAMSHLREKETLGWGAVAGLVLGLALSAKFTVVAIFPAIALHMFLFPRNSHRETLPKPEVRKGTILLMVMAASMVAGWLSLSSFARFELEASVMRLHYYVALVTWIPVIAWMVRHRREVASPVFLVAFVLILALGTFMIVPPTHLTNPVVISSLVDRFQNEMGWNPAFMGEAAALHVACVVFKSSPLIGVGLLVGPVVAVRRWRAQERTRFPLLLVGFYVLALVLLPLAQTFYMMPVLPILAILASDQLLTLASRRKVLAGVIGGAAATVLVVDLILCYPDFNLNGYQWLGARYLAGRSTIGYRSVVQTTSDGVEQAGKWLNAHAQAGDRVVAYVYPWHILEATCSGAPFRLARGEWLSVRTIPDYVVVHINHTIRQRWAAWFTGGEANARGESVFWEPYDAEWLEARFTKVMSVERAFGIEMASVWERN